MQVALIAFQAQDVVTFLAFNLPGYLLLAPHRIDDHHGTGYIQS